MVLRPRLPEGRRQWSLDEIASFEALKQGEQRDGTTFDEALLLLLAVVVRSKRYLAEDVI
jgi:hypothetical protein